ncbi:hypothetical protein [Streptomyces sp. SA15]|nr:hypothetical protein [Streptomyces sp. SA15]
MIVASGCAGGDDLAGNRLEAEVEGSVAALCRECREQTEPEGVA